MTKKCVICNNDFEAQRADAEVCSPACRQKNWRRKKDAEQGQPEVVKKEEPRTEMVVDNAGLKEIPAKKVLATVSAVNDKINKQKCKER